MALHNFYTIVNFSGDILQTTVDHQTNHIIKTGEQSTGHLFKTGEEITVTIGGHTISLFLPKGENSWSTIVYDKKGRINIFPSSPCQQKLSY